MTARDGNGETRPPGSRSRSPPTASASRADAGLLQVDLTGHYNNDGISEQGDSDDSNFDDAGWAFAGETLPAAGRCRSSGSRSTSRRSPGSEEHRRARGQTLPVTAGKYDQIELLVSAHHGNQQPNLTLDYADGTVNMPLRVTDWAPAPAFGERIAIAAAPARPTAGTPGRR